ncbi:MAG: methylmalonyl-CoA epimerase, partial [Candidatus Neomarinimicrobiota bacterium]
KILGIEHIGIAISSHGSGDKFWNLALGLKHRNTETVEDQKVKTDIYETGGGKIELLEAIGTDSPVAKFIAKRGTGIHHLCLEVDNIKLAIKELINNNIKMIDHEPRVGAEGYLVAFIHPHSTGGVLVELAEKQK